MSPPTLIRVLVTVEKWYYNKKDPVAVLEADPDLITRAQVRGDASVASCIHTGCTADAVTAYVAYDFIPTDRPSFKQLSARCLIKRCTVSCAAVRTLHTCPLCAACQLCRLTDYMHSYEKAHYKQVM